MDQSSLKDDLPVDEADEQLVAYLDGELPQNEVRTVELRLANDPDYRKRLRELQNGWEMLDELPLPASSSTLLETTLRMAAFDGAQINGSGVEARPWRKSISKLGWYALLVAGAFGLGIVFVNVRNYRSYQKQLSDLPIALHVDAYLQASNLELMKLLQEMPEWQQATRIADRLGFWNFDLVEQIQSVKSKERESVLQGLPMESQEAVRAALERFEKIDPDRHQLIHRTAELVARQPDPEQLLRTMDQFAAWRQTLPIEQRDQLEKGTVEQRKELIRNALAETTKQWTRDQGRSLTDDEIESIYSSVRQLGLARLEAAKSSLDAKSVAVLDSLGFGKNPLDPQLEASFLRRLFDPKYDVPGRREGEPGPPPFPPPAFPSTQGQGPMGGFGALMAIRNVVEQIRGPLRDDELYLLVADLPSNLSSLLDDASSIPFLQEELLRSWAEESLRRMQWNRSGRTALDRYQARSPEERDMIDLLPADRFLRSLQSETRR